MSTETKLARTMEVCQIVPPYKVPSFRFDSDSGNYVVTFMLDLEEVTLVSQDLNAALNRYIQIMLVESETKIDDYEKGFE